MTTPPRDDCLRLLAANPEARLPGWRLLRDDGNLGLLLQHASGRVAAIDRIATLKQARVSDVTSALKDRLGHRRASVDWALLYCEHGYLESVRNVLARRTAPIALLTLNTSGKRHVVESFDAQRLDDAEGRSFVTGCALAIQEAIYGVPREPVENHLGFTNFSVAPRNVEAITFMSEREYGRRRVELIRQARRSVVLSTYNIDSPSLEEELIARAAEGLDVHCIVGGQKRIAGRNARAVKRLSDNKVRVHPTENHAKCLIVDRRFVIMGSANASESVHQALEFNLELNAPSLADELLRILEARVPEFRAPPGP